MIAPARALAFETIRATFEQDAHTERVFREAADARGVGGRERAQAQRLAYGAVQRRGTADAAIERLAERSPRLLDPPVIAALRLGLYELLFADATPDHAAVDQAVELVKGAGAAHASGLVNAVLRRAGRERGALTEALLGDDSTPERAAVAHSAPLWLARMWWEELGAEAARSLLAACNEPAELALRVNTLRADREAMIAALREAGVEARAPDGALAAGAAGVDRGRGPDRRRGPRPGRRRRADPAEPRLRRRGRGARPAARASTSSTSAPAPGSRPARSPPGWATAARSISVEQRPRPGGGSRGAGAAPRPAQRHRDRGRRGGRRDGPGFDRVLVDAPCSDLGALASRPDARWRKSPRAIERLAELQGAVPASAAWRRCARAATLVYSTCTISRRENEERIAALLGAGGGGRGAAARGRRPRRARAGPRLAATTRAACSCAPTAIARPVSSSAA